MPRTYETINTTTLTTNTVTITFSDIPTTYTDLVLVSSARLNYTSADRTTYYVRVGNNSVDTGSNYSFTRLGGNGSTAFSGRGTNQTYHFGGVISEVFCTHITHINNYSNSTTNKTILTRGNSTGATASDDVGAYVGLWRNTNPINIVAVTSGDGTPFVTDSVFSLYGIKAA